MKIIKRPECIFDKRMLREDWLGALETYLESSREYIDYLEAKLNNVDLATVVDSYSEKDMDNAYDKGFKDAMIKYHDRRRI